MEIAFDNLIKEHLWNKISSTLWRLGFYQVVLTGTGVFIDGPEYANISYEASLGIVSIVLDLSPDLMLAFFSNQRVRQSLEESLGSDIQFYEENGTIRLDVPV